MYEIANELHIERPPPMNTSLASSQTKSAKDYIPKRFVKQALLTNLSKYITTNPQTLVLLDRF
jgi:hypothetical protein